jgi:hypothetical protein
MSSDGGKYNVEDNKGYSQHVDSVLATEAIEPKDPQTTVENVMAGGVSRMTVEERYAAFELAQQQDPGPPFWSKSYMHFLWLVVVTCMCSGDNGEWWR